MDKSSAKNLISDLFTHKFDDKKYQNQFLPNLLGSIEGSSTFEYSGNLIKHKFKDTVAHFKRYAKHTLSDGNVIDLLYVKLHSGKSLDKNRNSLRNYIASYLSDKSRDAALVVFVENDFKRWRLSFIRLDHSLSVTAKGSITTKEIATPAKRYSFLLGDGEASHTAQNQFIGQLSSSVKDVSLNQLEELFAVDKLNDEFFEEYKKLLEKTKNGILSAARESNYYQVVEEAIKTKDGSYIKYRLTSDKATIDVNNFTKKLLGQLVFLYFLQKKGWLGVAKDKNWGEGNIHFLRSQFTSSSQDNFFGKVLEPLFYEALATERDQS